VTVSPLRSGTGVGPRRRLWLTVLLAAASGILWGLQFGREPYSWASWLALAPLVLLLSRPRPFLLGFVHGLAAWLVSLSWIPATLVTFGKLSPAVAVACSTLLAAYLALFHAAFASLGALVWRRFQRPIAPLLLLPALWVALEWLRTYLFGGFPWNLSAYAWLEVPGALPLSAWVGAYGISYLLVLANTGVALTAMRLGRALRTPGRPVARLAAFEPLAALLVPLLLFSLAGRWSVRQLEEEAFLTAVSGVPVRLVQPNIPNQADWDPQAALANYRRLMEMTVDSCQPGVLVVWPESAAWPFLYGRDAILDRDLARLLERGCSVVLNTSFPVAGAAESYYNSIFLIGPGEAPVRYDKRHLVPFGEYVPFGSVFSFVDKLAREAGNYLPGTEARLLRFRGEKLGPAVCYEVVFPEEVSDLTRAGATTLLTVTNDAWYGDTAAPWQHLAAARFRAAEQRRPLIRAAITGVSAMVRPDGSVASQIGVFRQGVIRGWVAGRSELSPFARCSWLVPFLASVAAAVGLALALAHRPNHGAALRYPSDPTLDDDPDRRSGRGASRP
jgi:apolipoprotein N-acyltransferase